MTRPPPMSHQISTPDSTKADAARPNRVASIDRQRWARNEDARRPEPLPGYVWLDTRGKRTHVWAEHLEIRDSDG